MGTETFSSPGSRLAPAEDVPKDPTTTSTENISKIAEDILDV